ncbi:MAG: UDP-2,3-diacylglucosamine diphosphatase [Pseudomonadota bacterium]
MKATAFISDLHLDESRPHTISLALDFFKACTSYNALYILGDFFEYWIGDDAIVEYHVRIFDALKRLGNSGCRIYVMHGNRDFLLSAGFLAKFGVELINQDHIVIDLYGQSTLILHGDTLCTDDVDYQNFRRSVRAREWQTSFLSKPLADRQQTVAALREKSRSATAEKTSEITDVNVDTVISTLNEHNVVQMIHGHTHRPAVHQHATNNANCFRYVLGEWATSAEVAIASADGIALKSWPNDFA